MLRVRKGRRRSAWWIKEVREVVRMKKLAYRNLLNQGSKEAKLAYNDIKKEAKIRGIKAQGVKSGRGNGEGCQGHVEEILAKGEG